MPSYVTPKKNTEYVFYISLTSQADTKLHQANPTFATGDAKVATDDGSPANLNTIPSVDADFTDRVKVTLSASEMNGDNITVILSDSAGAEWCDLTVNIATTANQIDDLAKASVATESRLAELDSGNIPADVAAIVADTNELQGDWANGGRLDLLLDATLADTSEIQSDLVNGGRLDLLIDSVISKVDTIDDFLDTEVAAILADTNELQTDWVNGGRLDLLVDSIISKVDTVDNLIDTEIAAIKTDTSAILLDTGTTLPATLSTIDSEIGTVDTVADAIKITTDKMVFTTSNQLDVQVVSMATNSLTASAAAADFIGAAEIAASASAEIADLIAADWVAGDASPLAIVAALKADAEWSNLATIDSSLATMDSNIDAILLDTAQIGTAGSGLTEAGGTGDQLSAVPWNSSWDSEVQSEATDALVALKLDHLVAVADGDDPVDGSIMAHLASASEDWSTFVPSDDALEAIRVRGDASWITATGFNTSTPPTAAAIVNEWESQSQADSTGFHVNVIEIAGTAQTANDNGADINAILADTAEIGSAGAGLTAIDLPNQTMDITGNLSGSVGSVTGAVGSVTGAVGSVVGHTVQTGDSFARIGAPVGASISADVAAVQADLPIKVTKNVALAAFPFPMVDATDGITSETGKSVTAERSLDGNAFAACANAVTEISDGWYKISLDAADLNGDTIALRFASSGCADTKFTLVTQAT